MNKRLIKWQIKEWIPQFFILFVVFSLFIFIGYSQSYLYYFADTTDGIGKIEVPTVGLINVPAMLFSTIAPLIVYDYRYRKNAADTFYQLPLKKNEFRNTRMILALLLQIIVITFFYLVMVLMVVFKQMAAYKSMQENENIQTIINNTKLIYYLPYYFVLILATCANYFCYCFVANLANRRATAVLYVLMTYFITSLFLTAFFNYHRFHDAEKIAYYAHEILFVPSPHGIGNSIYYIFDPLLNGKGLNTDGDLAFVRVFVTLSETLLAGIGSFFFTFLCKDPSGEQVGSLNERYKWTFLIPHLFFFTVSNGVSSSTGYTGFFVMRLFTYCFFAVIYYLTLCLIRKKFTIRIVDIILIASITLFGFLW